MLRRLGLVDSWARVEWQSSVCSPGPSAWGALSSFHSALVYFTCHFFLSTTSSPRSGFLSSEEVDHGVGGLKQRQEEMPSMTHAASREYLAERHVMNGPELRQCEGDEGGRTPSVPPVLKQKVVSILCTLLGKKEKQTGQVGFAGEGAFGVSAGSDVAWSLFEKTGESVFAFHHHY